MTQKMPVNMQIHNLKLFILQHYPDIDLDQLDLEAHVDRTLGFEENRKEIARKLGIPIHQMGGRVKATSGKNYNRRVKKEIDEQYCDWLAEKCESHCNNASCKIYRKVGCNGEVTPCKPSRYNKQIRQKHSSGGECKVRSYCVSAHTRPPQHNSRNGKEISVGAYCVTAHPRTCRRSGYG